MCHRVRFTLTHTVKVFVIRFVEMRHQGIQKEISAPLQKHSTVASFIQNRIFLQILKDKAADISQQIPTVGKKGNVITSQ